MNQNSPVESFSKELLTFCVIDIAINEYIDKLPKNKLFTWISTDIQLVWTRGDRKDKSQSEKIKKKSYDYSTSMKCAVNGNEIRHDFPGQSISALRSPPRNEDGAPVGKGDHRLRGKWKSEDDTNRLSILAGIISEYYYRRNYDAIVVDNVHYQLKSGEAVPYLFVYLKEFLKSKEILSSDKEKVRSIELILSRNDNTLSYVSTNDFKKNESLFRHFFFVGPEYRIGNNDKDYNRIIDLWDTTRLSSRGHERLMEILCGKGSPYEEERNNLLESILTQASSFPLVATLNKPGNYQELQELLRQITRFEMRDENGIITIVAKVKPPLAVITDSVLRPLYDNLKDRMYTGYDYIIAHGKIAAKARENKNHSFNIEDLSADLWPFVEDGLKNKLLIEVDGAPKTYKYKTRQHRLYVRAMQLAVQSNQSYFEHPFFDRTSTEIQLLLSPSRINEESSQNEQSGLAKKHYSGRAWFAVVFLEYIDAVQRKVLLVELEKIANNFDTQNDIRELQEKSLSIGSYLLLEKSVEYPRWFCEELFLFFYGRALYEPQAEMWPLLRESSGIFKAMAKQWFRIACIGHENNTQEECKSDKCIVPNPDRQAYFNFLQGDLYSDEELLKLQPSLRFAIEACKLNRISWYLCSESERRSIQYNIVDKIFDQLNDGLAYLEKPVAPTDRGYIHGVSMLLYSIADIINRKDEFQREVEEIRQKILKVDVRNTLLKSLLLCDYYSRITNTRYPYQGNECHIICGGIRVVCAIELGAEPQFPVKEYLEEINLPGINSVSMRDNYQRWIDYHLSARPRDAFLIYRLLSYYDFGQECTFKAFLQSKSGIINYYKNFLPYDQMCDDVNLFFKHPTKVWTDEAKKKYERSHVI